MKQLALAGILAVIGSPLFTQEKTDLQFDVASICSPRGTDWRTEPSETPKIARSNSRLPPFRIGRRITATVNGAKSGIATIPLPRYLEATRAPYAIKKMTLARMPPTILFK